MKNDKTTGRFISTFDSRNFQHLIGVKRNRLTVLAILDVPKKKGVTLRCKCDCGNETEAYLSEFLHDRKKSCGCLRHRLQGLCYHPLYKTWINMTQRAGKHRNYLHVSVCDEWKNNFLSFYTWSINHGWKQGLTIDRIDYTGNYEPQNCRWTTQAVQCRNKKTNHYITMFGERKCLTDWAKEFNVNPAGIYKRVYRHKMSFEDAIKAALDSRNGSGRPQNRVSQFGENKSIAEWSKTLGVTRNAIYMRARKHGCSFGEAIRLIAERKERLMQIRGKESNCAQC